MIKRVCLGKKSHLMSNLNNYIHIINVTQKKRAWKIFSLLFSDLLILLRAELMKPFQVSRLFESTVIVSCILYVSTTFESLLLKDFSVDVR